MAYCAKHGLDNPACHCDPFSHGGPHQPFAPAYTKVVGLTFDEATAFCIVLGMFGWDTQLQMHAEFRAPLQKYPRQMVCVITTNCPVERLYALMAFALDM